VTIGGGRKSNLEHFHYCNLFQIFTDFELFQRFQLKAVLTDLCSISLIATIFPNRPELLFGKGVLHGNLKSLNCHLYNMHNLSPNIQEVMQFPIWLSVKQILHNSSVWNLCCIALFGPLKKYFQT
jgi:hypothetical protein